MNLQRGLKTLIVVAMVVALGSGGVFAVDTGDPPAEEKELSRLEQAKLNGPKPHLEENVPFTGLRTPPDREYCLWYDEPGIFWSHALPIGNGRLGAMVYGGIQKEILTLGEDTLWGGPPKVIKMPKSARAIAQARELCFQGKYRDAEALLNERVLAPGVVAGSYQFTGQLGLDLDIEGQVTDYQRDLDLATAVASVRYKVDGVQFQREVFASAVDDVIVIRLTADKLGCISGVLSVTRDPRNEREELVASGLDRLIMTGQACQKVRPRNPEVLKHVTASDLELHGVKFAAHYQMVPQNGRISVEQGSRIGPTLHFQNCDAATIYFTVATDYNKKDPHARLDCDLSGKCDEVLKRAVEKDVQALKSDSVAAHSEAFSRVDLSLGKSDRAHLPTDERIRAITDERPDTALEALLYQYGRYLLICSSRKGTQTMGLKGIWATGTKCSWNGDYHININQQMNYWPAETGNLSECHDPFFSMLEGMLPAGRELAREALGCRGFTAVHTTDPYFYTALQGKLKYSMWVVGGAWCSAHLMEHYRFTGDTEFLEERALPILKECSLFFLDWLVKDPKTSKLVSGPTCSPENRFSIAGQSSSSGGQVSMGPAMDQEIIWETFTNYLDALQELGIEDELSDDVRQALAQLDLPKIGKDGRILEWGNAEFVEVEPGHRHVSHLYAVYPGSQFSWNKTPRFMAAAKKSLEHRLANDGGQTGWSRAWTINFWARFLEGDKAHDNLVIALKNNSYDNLFNVNPPFIIDGNFGYASGIAEMLLQSHAGELYLLPALPAAWSQGAVKGLCARQGFEVDLQWNAGKLVSGRIQSKLGKDCTVHYGDTVNTFQTQKGMEYDVTSVLGL